MYLYRQAECFSGLPSLSHPCVISKSSKILTSEFTNHIFSLFMQAMLLRMLSLVKDVDQFSWSMYAAVALKNLSWTVITMVWDFPHVDTGKMLELFAKVRCFTY